MNGKNDQSEREFRSGLGQVGGKAESTNNVIASQKRLSQVNASERQVSQCQDNVRRIQRTPSEGYLGPLTSPVSGLPQEKASLVSCRDSGVGVSDSTLYRDTPIQVDELPTRENGDMYYGSHSQLAPGCDPIKGGPSNPQDSMLSLFPDDDSGFNSTMKSRSRSGLFVSDDFNNSLSPTMNNRSRSMSRLQLNISQDLTPTSSPRYVPFDRSLRDMKHTLDDSENRRVVLVHKLKEAQETLELQNDRLNKIEGTAKTNTVLVDDLKYKEMEYKRKLDGLQHGEDEKHMLQMENGRLRDQMQDRIDKLDLQLRSLQAQHQVAELENIKRTNLLEQTTHALALLEGENTKMQKDKDILRHEILVAKEALEMARTKFGPMEEENGRLLDDVLRVKAENERLQTKSQLTTNQMCELRDLTETMKDENEKLATSWKTLSEEKQRLNRELDSHQDGVRESKSRISNLSTERDRMFQEKMDLTAKVQQLLVDKEQVEKTKIALEQQVVEQEEELGRAKKGAKRKDADRRKSEEAYQEVKRNCDDLYKELASVKAFYERSLEQISVLENGRQLATQQQELAEQEKARLRAEVDRHKEIADTKTRDLKQEREQLEDAVLDLKGDIRDLRQEKSRADDKIQELDIKLQKANGDLKETVTLKQGEVESLRSTCDRLSACTSQKEVELQSLADSVQKLDKQNERLTEELRSYKEECAQLSDQHEDTKKLKGENRRLLQERAENEQVIKLLETQKDVLTKSAESNVTKFQNIEKLSDKVGQYRDENEHLRGRITELEKVRDNLITQKEELLANSESIYKKPQLEELESKIEELRDANKQLREINEEVNENAEMLGQENATLKDAIGGDGSVVPRIELERLSREKERLQSDHDLLKEEHENLEERHQRFIIQYGHEGSETQKDKEEIEQLEKEKSALEKQVALINGQMLLVEGGRKRLDDVVDDLQNEIVLLRQQLEEAEKNRPWHQSLSGPEFEVMQTEIGTLSQQLDEAKYDNDKQRRLITQLKEELDEERNKKPTQIRESLDDVGTELHEMRDELQKLMGVIESKDHAIETLENQLRTSKDQIRFKERAMVDLQNAVSNLEGKNEDLHRSVDGVRHSVEEKLLSPGPKSPSQPRKSRSPITRASRIPRKLDDGKGSSDQIHRSQSEKGSDRLQSLISKYRNYSDSSGQMPERKIKPLSLSPGSKMGLVTKGRSFGPAAPKSEDKVHQSS